MRETNDREKASAATAWRRFVRLPLAVKRVVAIVLLTGTIIAAFLVGAHGESMVAAAQELSVSQARRAIARTAGIELPTGAIEVEREDITVLGSSATVEAKVTTAFRLQRTERDGWEVAEIRVGDNRWEDVALLRRALDREKELRARTQLETLRVALEAFRRERGHYPRVETARELVDHLSPRYLSSVLRLDPWHQPYEYNGALNTYRLLSAGADRRAGTADDVTLTGVANSSGRQQ